MFMASYATQLYLLKFDREIVNHLVLGELADFIYVINDYII